MSHVPEFSRRPWGEFQTIHNEGGTVLKVLRVKPGQRLSLQSHRHRREIWYIQEGSGIIDDGDNSRHLIVGDRVTVGVEEKHRLTAGPDGVVVIELQFAVVREDDIERYEDDHGRIEATQ